MSTPDKKARDAVADKAGERDGASSEDPDLALGETLAGAPSTAPASSASGTRPTAAASASAASGARKADAVTLKERELAARSSQSLPKHIEDTLHKGVRAKVIEDELPRGASLGRYIVLSCLGAGGMGVVYAAYDPELDRKVAIKLLRTDTGGSQASQARLRLLREAQAMARLQHPQVIAVYDVGTIRDQVFIAMEFIDGSTLTQWLKDKPRTRREIIDVFTLAGRGLAAAHAVGLIHRDFKPDNVLVGKDGQVRVTDFGLARSVDQSDEYPKIASETPEPSSSQALSVHLTRTGAMMGTPRYMAPEQYAGGKTEPRTDLFSYCVALYEALYELGPFAGDTIASLGFNVVHGRVRPAPSDSKVPTWLRQVLLRGLSVAVEDRYASVDDLLTALNRERGGGSRLWLLMVALIVAALGGNLVFHLRKSDRESPCRGFESKLAGIWDEPRKQELKRRMMATGMSYAGDSWQRIEQALDSYTENWVKMRSAACMATVHAEQSTEIFELRRRCLDEHLQEVQAYTSLLEKAEEVVVENANIAVHDLPSLLVCADVEALRAPQPLPENPKERAAVERLIQQLADVRTEQRFGRYGIVIEKARTLAKQASLLKYAPVKAEALYLQGLVEERGGMGLQAERTLVQAAAAAMESHNQRLVALTWIRLTALTSWRLNQPERAESWEMLADAALESANLSDAQPLLAQLEVSQCLLQAAKRAYDKAIDYCERGLALRSKLYGASSAESAEVLHTIAVVYRRQENFEQAMRYYQQALEVEQKVLGPLHPDIASELRGIGVLLREQRRYRESSDYLARALAIVEKSLGPEHVRTSDFLLLVGINQLLQNRPGEALRPLQRSFQIREKLGEREGNRRAETRYFLGEALARLGRYGEALTINQTGLELAEKDPNRKEIRVAYNLHAIGATLFAMGRASEAVPYLERSLSIRQNLRGEEHRTNLNRLAETQFALAQAQWALGRGPARKRAVELARAAQSNYTDWGNKPENELSTVTAWLAEGAGRGPQATQSGFTAGLGSGATKEGAAAVPGAADLAAGVERAGGK